MTVRVLVATQLYPGDTGVARQSRTLRHLSQLVSEWGPQSGLDITIAKRGRAVRWEVCPLGTAPEEWIADVRWALGDLAVLTARKSTSRQEVPAHLVELRITREVDRAGDRAQPASMDAQAPDEADEGGSRASQEPWPRAIQADLADLFRADVPGLVVRYLLSGSSVFERSSLEKSLDRTWTTDDVHLYRGDAPRVRTLIGSSVPLPARARTIVRQWGSGVSFVPVKEAATAWEAHPLDLVGRAVPSGAVPALMRLPEAAGCAFPGIRTAASEQVVHVLDPVPARAKKPVRLGRARTATGGWVDVCLDLADLTQHCFVQGSSGSGKSTLLVALALAIQAAGGSFTLVDPDGSTVDMLLQHAPEGADIRAVRHGVEGLDVPVNIFGNAEVDTELMVDLWAEMIQRGFDPEGKGMVGPRWRRFFGLVAHGVAELYGHEASLLAVTALSGDMDRVGKLARALQPVNLQLANRLLSEYGKLPPNEAAELVSWAVSKFQPLLASPSTRWVLGNSGRGVDMRRLMDSGSSLAIDLGMHRLGNTGARIVGATWLVNIWAALPRRRHRDRPHVLLVDEAHLFQYGALPQLLAQSRKYGFSVVIATQHIGQLSGELADALESNTGSLVVLRSGLHSASRAAARLDDFPVRQLSRLPRLTAIASLSREGVATPPFTLDIDHHRRRARSAATSGMAGIVRASQEMATLVSGADPLSETQLLARLDPPAPSQPNEPVEEPRSNSFLDDWLAKRQAAQEERAAEEAQDAVT